MTEDVPGYQVLEQVGEGGFSVVYRAHQERLDRMVALKVMSVGAVDAAAMRRFQRECKITGRLSGHPNIVTVLDTGTTRAGHPYIVMEYFEHGALTDRLEREGPLPVADVLRIGVKMAGALAATHETDVLHRDVKPQNVLLSRYGEPALADFGIAGLVDSFDATHTQAFTPHHAAPEILEGRPPGVASDLYSLGSTLYHLLAGRPAFKGPPGEGIAQLMLRILYEAPPPIQRPDVPAQVSEVIGRAMAKAAELRFATAVEFAQALQRTQAELGLPVTDVAFGGGTVQPASSPASAHARTLPPAPAPGLPGPPPVPEWASTVSNPPEPPPPVPEWAPTASGPHPHASHGGTGGGTGGSTAPLAPGAAPAGRTQDGPRRGLIVAAGVALVGGLGLGVGALALANGGAGDGGTDPAARPSETVPQAGAEPQQEPVTAAQFAATRPRKLAVRRAGRTVTLAWTLPPDARRLPLLIQQQPAGSKAIATVPAGSRTTTVPGLRPKVRYCFKVGTVLRLHQGAAPDVSWSAPACAPAPPGG